ncbi:NAD(P)/FAD-dependent oxidoreductase [Pedobacter sp. SYSU D00535]|uniref:FAD-dependent oxidoreductase n=1 Tax=Pedobacter sp. SYSU D00535 TaxID=2810308 RepID=UPI001A97C6F2|nr:FAD-dependent monooxygenase [Pedobacter sp. SYSU D00535]
MTTFPSHTSVLIVGAGPSGLMMAAQLLRNGIHPVIIDSKTSLTPHSKALAIQSRSLEIIRQMGLHDLFLQHGNIVRNFEIQGHRGEVSKFDLTSLGKDETEFPFVLILEQSKTERLLLDYLTNNACSLYWNSSLTAISSSDEGVKATVDREGQVHEIYCDWVVAADGASSKVRQLLNIPFRGKTYEDQFYLADVDMRESRAEEAIGIFVKDEGFAGYFPMQGETVRFIGNLPQTLKGRPDIAFSDLKPYLTYTLGSAIPDSRCRWFSVYKLHQRVAEKFKVQRCFLIGDAAHVHSPAGGQGMNTGLQDAYNLAWKLSGVIKGSFDEQILETYAEERMEVAKKLLATTDRIFSIGVSQNWLVRKLRKFVLPRLLRFSDRRDNFAKSFFPLISQTGVQYRTGPISVHHSQSRRVQAGDRLPYIKLFDEKLKRETDLHQWCAKPGFTLLVIGWLNSRDLMLLAKWITQTFPFNLNFYYLPHSEKNQHVFDLFEVGERQKKAVIVRPDLYIGYINDAVVIELIETYLKDTVGWKS